MTLPRSSLDALTARLEAAAQGRKPPVDQWNPSYRGQIDMRIARDGRWFHEGGEIKRQALVALFASILRRDEDAHWLVTPAEMLRITVDDTPFLAVDIEVAGAGLANKFFSRRTWAIGCLWTQPIPCGLGRMTRGEGFCTSFAASSGRA